MIVRFIKALLAYLLVVASGTILFIAGSPVFGYLAYSDRPGAGFHHRAQPFSLVELWGGLRFGAGYAVFLAPYLAVFGTIGILAVRGLERTKVPRAAIVVVGGLLFLLGTGYVALAIGWYIAAGGVLTLCTALLGGIAGAVVIPNRNFARLSNVVGN